MAKIAEILRGRFTGQDVELKGWIYRTRTVGGKAFVVLRDSTGVLQVAVARDSVPAEAFEAAEKALIESSVIARGTVVEDKRAPGGYELRAKDFRVVHYAEKFPIQKDLSEEFLLDVRHLWVRSQRMTTIFRVRHTVFAAVHEYFRNEGFWEVHPPMITPVGSEGGSTLFEVEYFGRKAYLTQSWQLYAEALVLAMEKVYYIGPSFRAEKSRTTRHLTEFWHCEMEEAWAALDDIAKHAERVIEHAAHRAAEENPEDLTFLGRDPEELKRVRTPFEHITYDEALRRLREKGMEVEWGKDLRTLEERALTDLAAQPIIVSHYPRISQAFYKRRDPNNP
ncbi:MAG: asparagine--tRNA ligase, partial [Euryarchaeota archaeon]|nr:asparagine--tRNA ligase [Euryarchaeota archaeon]